MGGHAVEEERIKRRFIFCGQLREDLVEGARVGLAEAWRCEHAGDQYFNMPRGKLGEDRIERLAGDGGIGATQHVIGAELQNDSIGAIGERPIEPRQAARGCVAGDAGIDDVYIEPIFVQSLLKHGGKGLVRGQQIAGTEAVAESDEFERVGGAGARQRHKPENRRNHPGK